MYSKSEAADLKRRFWSALGQYLKPVAGAAGETINWINYKTGIRYIFFRMDVTKNEARVAVEITAPDAEERHRLYEKWYAFLPLFEETAGEDWNWQKEVFDEDGAVVSRMVVCLTAVSIFNTNDWPVIISFLKEKIMALDRFWAEVKPFFET